MDGYRTIDREVGDGATAEIVVLRSVFLAEVRRVETEADARAVIAGARARHHDARHHCTAMVLGPDGALRRSNDDGEPSGTAGRPMLDVVTGRGLSDVVVVVTRWFGGTLLGAGGLVRAYGDATAAALDAAGVRHRVRRLTARVTVPLAQAGALDHRLRAMGEVIGVEYADQAVFTLAVEDLAVLERLDAEPVGVLWRDL